MTAAVAVSLLSFVEITKICQPLFLWHKRRKEKVFKKKRQGVSPSAEGEEACAASTAPPFEKGGRKLLWKSLGGD
jgi:hypothetical protein